ncbi:MAG: aminopeptidase [Eggerthellaceae bacterium]|jgi:aspartyl aminopeptidase
MERKNAWKAYDQAAVQAVQDFGAGYIKWLTVSKTEREATANAISKARKAGYRSLAEAREAGKPLAPGDRVYADNHGKSLILVQVGSEPMERGFNILGAHIDSPRLDVKQNPLYESDDLALLDTHYYGGIKKYQWVTLPLAIHGVVAKTDGTVVPVTVGEEDTDPAFVVTDLLPHLGADQMDKKAGKVIDGEDLDVLAGGRPLQINASDAATDEEKERAAHPVKAQLLAILQEKYGIAEEDFLSAELEVVPAGPARDCGFDRSMVLGYGQDDSACAYPSLMAQLDAPVLSRTGVCVLVDKEEIGSVGATGMTSLFFENTMAEIMDLAGQGGDLALRRALTASRMLSSDVSAAFDPTYASAYEKKNAAFCGRGLVFNKFTGSRGKSGSNDANAEYIAHLRAVMDQAGVYYQFAELGKVDQGGGGTIAYILAKYGMDVIDSGVPVLSMHAPWEVTNKADVYEAYEGYKAFLENA